MKPLKHIFDSTVAAECQDIEFLLCGSNNDLFTIHKNNVIRLWKIPLYSCQDFKLHRVFICEGTIRHLHPISGREQFITCEFVRELNRINLWNVDTGQSQEIKGIGKTYSGSEMRICSTILLSVHILAILVADEGITHMVDIWNIRSNVCVHRHLYKAFLPVQNIYKIHTFLLVQPWSSMADVMVWDVDEKSYHMMDRGTLLTEPPKNIASYRCIISEESGFILAGGTQLKLFKVNTAGKILYVTSIHVDKIDKILDVFILHSNVYRLLIIDNQGVRIYNMRRNKFESIPINYEHQNKDILVRSDSGFTYRPYLFVKDNGLLIIQDNYTNRLYKYQIPIEQYVPKHYAEIRKNARIVQQGFQENMLPVEIWVKIVSFTGYDSDNSFARKIANRYFCRPFPI